MTSGFKNKGTEQEDGGDAERRKSMFDKKMANILLNKPQQTGPVVSGRDNAKGKYRGLFGGAKGGIRGKTEYAKAAPQVTEEPEVPVTFDIEKRDPEEDDQEQNKADAAAFITDLLDTVLLKVIELKEQQEFEDIDIPQETLDIWHNLPNSPNQLKMNNLAQKSTENIESLNLRYGRQRLHTLTNNGSSSKKYLISNLDRNGKREPYVKNS